MENLKVFACSDSAEKFTKEICDYLNIEQGKMNRMKFKNDNNFVQITETVRDKDVFLVQTTQPPVNERIMELLIAVDAIKRASAKRITVVLPYYIYSRSDKKDQPRIPVTAKLLAQLIANGQIATQYVDEAGRPSMDIAHNPNGSVMAVEGILSPDGRVFGKMGHSERIGTDIAKNIYGHKDQRIFEAGIRYFG